MWCQVEAWFPAALLGPPFDFGDPFGGAAATELVILITTV
jgi:hypothetical protein